MSHRTSIVDGVKQKDLAFDWIINSENHQFPVSATGLQTALNDLDATHGGWVLVPSTLDCGTTQITINKSNVSIISEKFLNSGATVLPAIKRIIIDATAGDISNIKLKGITWQELIFYANGHNILYGDFEDSNLRNDNTYESAVKLQGSGYVLGLHFHKCKMFDWSTAGKGMFNHAIATTGCGQIYFTECSYQSKANDGIVFYIDGRISLVIDKFSYEMFHTGHKFMLVKTDSIIPDLKISDGWFEHSENVTLFDIEAKTTANKMAFNLEWDNNIITTAGGKTVTFINNANDDWDATNFESGLTMTNGSVVGSGTFTFGTSGENAEFKVIVGDVRGFCEPFEDINADPWTDPTAPVFEGRKVTMHNAHGTFAGNPYRLYIYINAGWHYVVLT